MQTTIEVEDFEKILKRIVREVMQEELMKMKASLLPFISNEEQVDIEKRYGRPTATSERVIEIDV